MFSVRGPSSPPPAASLWYLVGDFSCKTSLSSWLLSSLSYLSVSSVNGFLPWTLCTALSFIILSNSTFSLIFFSFSFSRSHSCSLDSTSIFLAFIMLSPCRSAWLFFCCNTYLFAAKSTFTAWFARIIALWFSFLSLSSLIICFESLATSRPNYI